MTNQNHNLLLAAVLSFGLIAAWTVFFPGKSQHSPEILMPDLDTVILSVDSSQVPTPKVERDRIKIHTPSLSGSLSLLGGRIDDLSLNNYYQTVEPDSEQVRLLQTHEKPDAYYAVYGWAPINSQVATPGPKTRWTVLDGQDITPNTQATLGWDNGSGLYFERTIEVDEQYLFTITQRVRNMSTEPVSLAPYGILARHSEPETIDSFILHEGAIGMFDGDLIQLDYDDVADLKSPERTDIQDSAWLGFTDKYWMTTLIPAASQPFSTVFKSPRSRTGTVFQADFLLQTVTLDPGDVVERTTHLFSGAKEVETVKSYQESLGIDRFEDAVDWGWLFFLTKPIFWLLSWINSHAGNMGYSIILLTIVVRFAIFPIAYKAHVSIAKTRQLLPELQAIKEKYIKDRMRMQQETFAFYKQKKINPFSGFLPLILQAPIFFALYKVLFVTIEMRHAPFIGWIQDLSAPDPTSLLNLFGVLPWSTPEILTLGVFPIIMGISIWLQMKLNPAPTDPIQKKVFAWMPFVVTFMLYRFPVGLVIYWTASNVLTAIQQYIVILLHRKKDISPA